MADTIPTPDNARDLFAHLENLIQELEDVDLDEVIARVEAVLHRRRDLMADGPAVTLVPVQRPPRRPND